MLTVQLWFFSMNAIKPKLAKIPPKGKWETIWLGKNADSNSRLITPTHPTLLSFTGFERLMFWFFTMGFGLASSFCMSALNQGTTSTIHNKKKLYNSVRHDLKKKIKIILDSCTWKQHYAFKQKVILMVQCLVISWMVSLSQPLRPSITCFCTM